MPSLESLYFYDNNIKYLDRALQNARKLERVGLSFNKIEYVSTLFLECLNNTFNCLTIDIIFNLQLASDEFAEAEVLADLDIAYNQLKSLNGSLRPLKSLRYLNLTHNMLTEFSLLEIKGLKRLSVIDLSHNKIAHIIGNMDVSSIRLKNSFVLFLHVFISCRLYFQNLVDVETMVLELRLDHNRITSLDGALISVHGLLRLNISNNQITHITADDLLGLEDLKLLDVSNNQITSLDETSKVCLTRV